MNFVDEHDALLEAIQVLYEADLITEEERDMRNADVVRAARLDRGKQTYWYWMITDRINDILDLNEVPAYYGHGVQERHRELLGIWGSEELFKEDDEADS